MKEESNSFLNQLIDAIELIQFEYPYLLYLWIPPIIYFFFKIRPNNLKKSSLKYSFSRPLPENKLLKNTYFLNPLLQLATILLIIGSLAKPYRVIEHTRIEKEGLDIMIGLDISVSMNEKDFYPNRLEVAKDLAIKFIKNRKADNIGLVAFAGEPYLVSPITKDTQYLFSSIKNLKIGIIKDEGTAIGDAIGMCLNQLRQNQDNEKIGIIISDGNNTVGNLDPSTSSDLANYFNTKFYTIAVGSYQAKFDQVNEGTLSQIAQSTNGKFFRAQDENSLGLIFQEIDRIETKENKIVKWDEKIDLSYDLILIAFICFLLFLILKLSPFGTIIID